MSTDRLSDQLDFFTDEDRPQPLVAEVVPIYESIQAQFLAFHHANPWIYNRLVALARELTTAGHRRIGIGMLFEVLRWQYAKTVKPVTDDFGLNNNYRSRYARLIAGKESDLADVFEMRELRSA